MFVVNTDENVDARQDVGVAMYRAFSYIMKHESAVKALSFLTDVRSLNTGFINQCNIKLSLLGYVLISTKLLSFVIESFEQRNGENYGTTDRSAEKWPLTNISVN